MKHRFFQITSFALLALGLHSLAAVDKKNILMLAGNPSHGPGEHEHNAGIKLLARCLSENATGAGVIFHLNAQWPSSAELAKADTMVMYADGGGGHPALQGDHLQQLAKEMKRGCGFVCLHYAVEVPVTPGGPEFKDWLGGYFEPNWSVNPHWEADFKQLPQHPVCNGVKPFATSDEWYFHMRFRDGMKGVTPILTAIAPDSTMSRKDGPHEGNLAVRDEVKNKVPQHTAWAVEREDGGRGFGFTGGHFHKGWGNNDQRRLVLNAILWTAKMDVPANGVDSKITDDDLQANLDPKGQPKPHAASTPQPHPAAPGKSLAETGIIKKGPEKITASLKGLKELYLIATDGGDSYACDWADWAEPVLIKNDGTRIKLTELKPKMAHVGWGELGINKNAAGNELKINGKPVSFGFGAHAPSMIAFDLPEGIAAFESSVGVDNGGTDQGELSSVTFALYASNPEGLPQIAGKKPSPPSGPPYGLEAARKQMENFKTPAGLEAKLFAAEPMVQNPTNIDVDPQGRVWIAECVNYRHWATPPIRPEGDRIVVLEDTTGDGEADKETTFYQSPGLTNPLGLCVLPSASGKGTQVIVSAAPNVWLLTDTDGDGKADMAEILFKVGGEPNYDHQIHAFCFGPDGKFYFNGGNSLTELFWPDGSIVKDLAGNEITGKGKPYRQGMIFRCDINLATGKASNVETLAHNFRNNYEVCVDSLGGMWQSDNDDDGNKGVRINNIIEYGNYGFTNELDGAGWQSPRTNIESEIPLRHWHQNDPGTIPNLLQTGGGSPTGICVNEGGALGTAFENQLIHCDAGPRTVRAYPAKKNGAGYTAEMVDILTSSDNWYRPADCCIAPDGSLFIADWYDSGVGGHNMGDHDPKTMRGRIYRVAVTGQSYKITPPDFSTADGCATALLSPNNSTRFVAWTKLHAMGVTAEGALKKTMTAANPRYRARALHLLARTPGKFQTYIDKALADESADVRATAVREIRLAATDNTLPDSIKNVTTYIMPHIKTESDKQVLREYAITLRVLKEPQDAPGSSASNPEDAIAAAWVALAGKHDGNDRWYLESLGIGSMGREDRVLKAWLAKAGDNWNTPAGRDIIWRVRSPLAFDALVKILTDKNTKPEDLPHYLREFDFLPDGGAKSLALLKMLG
ncbi:MAG: PVC-type heme-binding CxxCH protein, partial [Verrucomicrobiaceae bacterium]